MGIKEKFQYAKLIMSKKINKLLQSHKTAYITGNKEWMMLERFADFYLTDYFNEISIIINKDNVNKKDELMQMVKYLSKKDKKIEIIEEEKMLNNDDIIRLAKINNKIMLNNIYIEQSKIRSRNEILECNISSYLLIMEKVEYLVRICREKFSTQEEQIIFTMVQISDYMRYGEAKDYFRPCLVNAFLMRVGVCIDFSIALWKVLTELEIECKLISGIANQNNNNVLIDRNHAWNQVKINNDWYNVELTWFNTRSDTSLLLVNDEKFEEGGAHKVQRFDNRERCTKNFNRDRIEELIKEYRQYKNVLREYDLGERKIVLKYKD